MNTDNDDWIKRAAQEPKARDYPIWVCDPSRPLDGDRNNSGIYLRNFGQEIYSGVKYWKPCTLPAPPKPEPTQVQEDMAAFTEWWGRSTSRPERETEVAWHAALAYRDTQNRKDLEELKNAPIWDPFLISKLRKRCGLD